MSPRLRVWLEGRSPRPPEDLSTRLLERLEASSTADAGRAGEGGLGVDGPEMDEGTVEGLLEAARSALTSAVSRPGRVRETAFELLVADALVTYACEAALETEAPEEALGSILAVAAEETA